MIKWVLGDFFAPASLAIIIAAVVAYATGLGRVDGFEQDESEGE